MPVDPADDHERVAELAPWEQDSQKQPGDQASGARDHGRCCAGVHGRRRRHGASVHGRRRRHCSSLRRRLSGLGARQGCGLGRLRYFERVQSIKEVCVGRGFVVRSFICDGHIERLPEPVAFDSEQLIPPVDVATRPRTRRDSLGTFGMTRRQVGRWLAPQHRFEDVV